MKRERPCELDEVITDPVAAVKAMAGESVVGLDLETGGLSPWADPIAVVSMYGEDSGRTAVVHVRGSLPEVLRRFLSTPGPTFVGHNVAGFDLLFLANNGVDVFSPTYYDSMIGEQMTLSSGRRDVRVSLQDSVARRLGVKLKKGMGTSPWMADSLSEEQLRYCVEDVFYLPKVRAAQLAKVGGTPQGRAMEFEQAIIPIVVRMVLNGLPLDQDMLDVWTVEMFHQEARARATIDELLGKGVNVNSALQLRRALSERLGVEVDSTDAETLQYLSEDDGDIGRAARAVSLARRALKRTGMYDDDWVAKYCHDGRVHSRFWTVSTDTFRMCVTGDTPVECPRDMERYPIGVPISELSVGRWVYSFTHDKKFCLRRVKWVGVTGRRRTLKVTMSAKGREGTRELRVTREHLVRLDSGVWKCAGDLRVGDRLMSVPRRRGEEDGKYSVLVSGSSRFNFEGRMTANVHEHRWVYARLNNLDRIPSHYDVHHKDSRTQNNDPSNLELLTHPSHMKMHRAKVTRGDVELAVVDPSTWGWHSVTLTRHANKYGIAVPKSTIDWINDHYTRGEFTTSSRQREANERRSLRSSPNSWGQGGWRNPGRSTYVVEQVEEYGEEEVWDLEVEDTHSFIGAGVVLHNSSSEPNLQQIPVDGRKIFGGLEGHFVVSVDYAQLEVRVAAAIARDSRMIAALDSTDIHTTVAASIFHCPVDQVSKAQRKLAKAATFTLLFGGSANGLIRYAKMSGSHLEVEEAQSIVRAFFNTYTGIAAARQRANVTGRQGTPVTLTLPNGAKRVLVPKLGTVRPSQILNTMVQGSAAIGLKYALFEADRRGLTRYLGAAVHDELVAVVPDSGAKDYCRELEEAMVVGMRRVLADVPVGVEGKVGFHWS